MAHQSAGPCSAGWPQECHWSRRAETSVTNGPSVEPGLTVPSPPG